MFDIVVVCFSDIDIPPPCCDGDPPAFWWDEESDRSLLVGVFKHGQFLLSHNYDVISLLSARVSDGLMK